MSDYLDDRMYVVCLGKFISEKLVSKEDRLISKYFRNIDSYSFYTEKGIVKSGDYFLTTYKILDDEDFNDFKNQKFDAYSLGELNTKKMDGKYAVLTFKNKKGYPPYKDNVFNSLEESVEYIREIIGTVPLVSLNGKPYKFSSNEEYREFIEKYDMLEFFRKKK